MRAARAFRRFVFGIAAFCALFALGATARAADPVGNAPRDVPVVLEPQTVVIPPLMSDMVSETHGWLTIAYPSSVKDRVAPLVAQADAFKAELEARLGQEVLDRVEVRVARSPEDMALLAPASHPPPAYAVGVAYPSLRLVLLSLRNPKTAEAPDLGEVFRHELVHVAVEDAFAHHHVPLWFNEGFAVVASDEAAFQRARTLWDATLAGSVLPLADLDKSFPDENYEVSIAYAESADFVRYLNRDSDRARFQAMVARVRGGATFDRALTDSYGTDLRKLEFEWREDLSRRFSLWPVLTGGSFLWSITLVVFGAAWWKRRKKNKETFTRWEAEEAAEERLRALAAQTAVEDDVLVTSMPSSAPPRRLHEGQWHTLH